MWGITPIKFLLTKQWFENALFVMFVILEITRPLAFSIYVLMANMSPSPSPSAKHCSKCSWSEALLNQISLLCYPSFRVILSENANNYRRQL